MSTRPRPIAHENLRREKSLLLACTRTHLSPYHIERIKTLCSGYIDWAWLLQAAARHRVAPLLYQSLSAASCDSIHQDTLRTLREHFRANALRNLILTRHLIQALRALDGHGIRAVPFKGPALAELAYGNLSLRQFADLDILVRARDVPKAIDTLASMGYRLALNPDVPKAAYRQSMHHHSLVRPDVDAVLELHWRLSERYFASSALIERLWCRLQPSTLAGAAVHTMADEDLLLFLCVHAAKHGWDCLAQICDIAECIRARAEHITWHKALSEASALGFERVLLLGLVLANTLVQQPLPAEIIQRIQADSALPPLVSRVQETLFREATSPAQLGESERFRFFRLHLAMRNRIRDKVFHCLRVALIPSQEDWASASLPSRLSFLYYVLRPVRLLVKYLRKGQRLPT